MSNIFLDWLNTRHRCPSDLRLFSRETKKTTLHDSCVSTVSDTPLPLGCMVNDDPSWSSPEDVSTLASLIFGNDNQVKLQKVNPVICKWGFHVNITAWCKANSFQSSTYTNYYLFNPYLSSSSNPNCSHARVESRRGWSQIFFKMFNSTNGERLLINNCKVTEQ